MKSSLHQKSLRTSRAAADVPTRNAGNLAPVVQRVNQFYGSGPQSTTVENPLFTIAGAVEKATGINAWGILGEWGKGSNLKIAKTYRGMLTSGGMATYQRPVSASAWLDTPNPNPGKRKDPPWITAVGNLGSVEDQIKGEGVKPYNGGHLIAWEFLNADANVPGNIAPQAALQNQALFRKIERSVEDSAKHGQGVEVVVTTPYHSDNYSVTMEQLIQRGMITNAQVVDQLKQKNALQQTVTLAQMAPDTYDVYFLTQTGVLDIASPDAREGRNDIKTVKLATFQGSEVTKLQKGDIKPLSILASNYNEETDKQEATAFAHVVFLNYRSNPLADEDMGLKQETIAEPKINKENVERARLFIQGHLSMAFPVLEELVREYGLSPTAAENALIYILLSDI